MKCSSFFCGVALAYLWVSGGATQAQLFNATSQTRESSIWIDDFSGFPPLTADSSAPDFNDWNDMLAFSDMGIPSSFGEANQNSSIQPALGRLTATGDVSGFAAYSSGDTEVFAETLYNVDFDTSQTLNWSVTGSGSTSRGVGNALESFTTASVSYLLRDTVSNTLITNPFVAIDDSGMAMVNNSGVIPAGSYEFSIFANVDVFAEFNDQFPSAMAEFDLTLDLTPVPEPTTIGLLVLGLVALAGTRRKLEEN